MAITRLIVFYHVCPAEIADLVIRPETIAPPISRHSSLLTIIAKCVDHAKPRITSAVVGPSNAGPQIKCTEGGLWFSIRELGCKCVDGYVPSMDGQQCEGEFKEN